MPATQMLCLSSSCPPDERMRGLRLGLQHQNLVRKEVFQFSIILYPARCSNVHGHTPHVSYIWTFRFVDILNSCRQTCTSFFLSTEDDIQTFVCPLGRVSQGCHLGMEDFVHLCGATTEANPMWSGRAVIGEHSNPSLAAASMGSLRLPVCLLSDVENSGDGFPV